MSATTKPCDSPRSLKRSYSRAFLSSSSRNSWKNLPDPIFGDIMVMVGREELKKCKRVSKSWNAMISLMTKKEKNIIRRISASLAAAARIRELWVSLDHIPLLPEIATAASLAHRGMLGSLQGMELVNVDLSSVPPKHLASLAACVTNWVDILDVRNTDLVSILDSVKCKIITICGKSQSLGSEGTRALVRAMESGVEEVLLDVNLDITALTLYTGGGKCRWVRCHDQDRTGYSIMMRNWSKRINWDVIWERNHITIER